MTSSGRAGTPVEDRSDAYIEMDGAGVSLPLHPEVITEAADTNGIETGMVKEGVRHHQRDLQAEGTVFGFVINLAENGECGCVYYSDEAVYLSVSPAVWEREREWYNGGAEVFNAIVDAHTLEVKEVAASLDDDSESIEQGYALGSRFPLQSVAASDSLQVPAFRIAERAEFLEMDVGIDRKDATAYAPYEWEIRRGVDDDEARRRVAMSIGIDRSEVDERIDRVQEWSSGVENLFQSIDDAVGGTQRLPESVFGTVAAITEDE